MIMKTVEPYMTIMSPLRMTPTLSASAAASMVPAMTGVPVESPVARAAFAVTCPAISVVHSDLGGLKPRGTLQVKATAADGKVTTFTTQVRIDTPEELVAFSHGGILPYVARQLAMWRAAIAGASS